MNAVRIEGAGGVNLAVYEGGNPAGHPVVFIHGTTQNYLAWERQLAAPLADACRLVSYDLRGHGASDKPQNPESYTEASAWADDLAAVIREKGMEKPVLVGWSYGGFIIADYVRRHGQDGIGGIVFVGTPPSFGTEDALAYVTDELMGMFAGVVSPDLRTSLHTTRSFMELVLHPLGSDSDGAEVVQIAYGCAMMVTPQVRQAMWSRAIDNHDVLAGIGVPTLVVHGGDDHIIRRSSAERVAGIVPGATLRIYEGSSHAPFIDAPDRFNRDLEEFVRSVHA